MTAIRSPRFALTLGAVALLAATACAYSTDIPDTTPDGGTEGAGGSGGGSAGGSGGGTAGGTGGGTAGGTGGGTAGGSGGGSAGGSGGGTAGGSGGGSAGGSGGGSAGGSGGGSAGGSGGGSAGGSGGGSAGGSGGGTAGGSGGGTASSTYCDGFEVADSSSDKVNVQSFAFGGSLKSEGCSTTVDAYADGTSLTTISGVFDLDAADNGAGSPAVSILVGNCSDLGLAGFTPTSSTITPPSGSVTVAEAYGSSNASMTVYGVVTAVSGWGVNSSNAAFSGSLYIQDATPNNGAAPVKSGSEIYFTKTYEATYGAVPNVGDVIAVSGVKWSPYEGVNEFDVSSTTTVTHLGTSALPTAVSITAAQAGSSSYLTSSGYQGMRVTLSGGPFTVAGSSTSGTCPTQLEYTPSGG